jgi:hypothetical protein
VYLRLTLVRHARSMRRRMRLRVLLAGAVLPLALWAALPASPRAPRRRPPGDIQHKIRHAGQDRQRKGTERVLTTRSAPTRSAIDRLQAASARLRTQRARAGRPRRQAAASCSDAARPARRARAARAAARRLAQARTRSPTRLVELYQADRPTSSRCLTAKGFADLLERGEFLHRVSEQDQTIIRLVRPPRPSDATAQRLDVLERASRRSPRIVRSAATRSPRSSRT